MFFTYWLQQAYVLELLAYSEATLYTCTYVVFVLSYANYHVLCRYELVFATSANINNRSIAFLIYNNTVSLNMISFLALKANLWGK